MYVNKFVGISNMLWYVWTENKQDYELTQLAKTMQQLQ